MANKQDTLANPETKSSDEVFGSDTTDFFESLDKDVNQLILEEDEISSPQEQSEQATQKEESSDSIEQTETVDWEKRYKDSSREAQKLKGQLDEVEPMIPILDTMKSDPGLINVVKNYLANGGKQENLKETLQLPEDFQFDMDEAISEPNGNSGRMFNAVISNIVESRVSNRLGELEQKRIEDDHNRQKQSDAESFKKDRNMSNEDFDNMMSWANDHKITLEDIDYLKNRDKVASNVANSTKADMLSQMKSVRDIPQSVGSANSVSSKPDPDEAVFKVLKNLDQGVDNLFAIDE